MSSGATLVTYKLGKITFRESNRSFLLVRMSWRIMSQDDFAPSNCLTRLVCVRPVFFVFFEKQGSLFALSQTGLERVAI